MKQLIIITLLLATSTVSGQNSPFFGNLKNGEHSVGFKTIGIQDSNRTYTQKDRPVYISVWYPSEETSESRVRFQDYLYTDALKLIFDKPEEIDKKQASKNFIDRVKIRGALEAELFKLTETTTSAYIDSKPAEQPFPLIISTQGGGRPAYTNFILNEYLASHGFIVASVGDIREKPNRRETTAIGNARALSEDLSLIPQTLLKAGFQVRGHGAIAFSRAGEAVIQNQVKEHRFHAAVFLDAQPDSSLLADMDEDALLQIEIPVMAFFSNHQNKMNYSKATQDSAAFEFLPKSQVTKIRMMESNHGNLTSAAMIGEYMVKKYDRWPLIGNAKLGYETVCRLTLEFLNEKIKGRQSSILNNPIEQLKLKKEFLVIHKAGKE